MLRLSIFFSIFLCFKLAFSAGNADWSFHSPNGPVNWTSIGYQNCTGRKQSPIAIDSSMATIGNFDSFQLTGYEVAPNSSQWNFENNGHGVAVTINDKPTLSGGGISGTYILDSFHWHFGSQNSFGSEHYIDGNTYAMEMHFVHYKKQGTGNLFDVWETSDGLAVLGVLFKIDASSSDNQNYEPIIKYLQSVTYKDSNIMIPSFNLRSLMPENIEEFYRYEGGLTTPPCYESVKWTVFKNPVTISQAQIDKFRTLKTTTSSNNSHDMADNRRPVQAIYDRTVYKTVSSDSVMTKFTLPLFLSVILTNLLSRL